MAAKKNSGAKILPETRPPEIRIAEGSFDSKQILIDTNCTIALLGSRPLTEAFYELGNAFLPAITVGELAYGAFNSAHPERNLARIDALLAEIPVIDCDAESAIWYGRIRLQLKKIGKPIPENDIWIAAIAMQHRMTLATKDRHFAHVENLACVGW